MENRIKKPLPHAVTKSQLMQMYSDQFSASTIRRHINEILKEQNISKHIKIVPHLSFKEFVATYGIPKGYYSDDS